MCLRFHYASHKRPPGFVCVCVLSTSTHVILHFFVVVFHVFVTPSHLNFFVLDGANVDAPRLALPAPRLSVSVKLL